MILEVAGLLERHNLIGRGTARDLRVAFLKTTEPTFLIFGARQPHPMFAVKVGERDRLETRALVTSRLHGMLAGGIARPFGVFPVDDGQALLVEEGLAGTPWFRIGEWCKTPDDWRELRRRAIHRLHEFHAAVATQADWVSAPRPLDGELRDMARALRDVLSHLGGSLDDLIDDSARELAALGAVPRISQHGDFVLNNLLVDTHQLAVLDFSDFGKWQAPFVDAFALAHSVNVLARTRVTWPHLADDLAACAAAEVNADSFTARQKIAFFVYFLLAAVTDTLQKPTRTAIRSVYCATLRDLLDEPSRYEHAFAAASSPSRM